MHDFFDVDVSSSIDTETIVNRRRTDYDRIASKLNEIFIDLASCYHSPRHSQGSDSVTIVKDELLHCLNEIGRLYKWVDGLAEVHKNAKDR